MSEQARVLQGGQNGPFERQESTVSEKATENPSESNKSKIALKVANMPSRYRGVYIRAITTNSLRAMKAYKHRNKVLVQNGSFQKLTAAIELGQLAIILTLFSYRNFDNDLQN